MSMATPTEKGPQPKGHHLALVTFDKSIKRYGYWVPANWNVCPGDTLTVLVPSHYTQEQKLVTVQQVAVFTLSDHKVAFAKGDQRKEPRVDAISPVSMIMNEVNPNLQRQFNDQHAMPTRFIDNLTFHTASYDFKALKEKTMNLKIETRTFLNDRPITSFDEGQLIQLIIDAEDEIKRLDAIEHKPEKLKAKIGELKAGIEKLVGFIDGKQS